MRRAADLDDYLAAWRDSYVVERELCVFHREKLFGVVVWGRPGVDEARKIVKARGAELVDHGGHDLILDYRLVEVIDPEAFRVIADWVRGNSEALARVTTRVALVKPADPFAAATVAGFYSVVKAPYPSQLCDTIAEAEAWLGVPTAAIIDEIHEVSSAGHTVMTSLGTLLEKQPSAGVEDAASALGMTARTLQRRLKDEGTTFLVESRKAKIRRAKHLLTTTDDKISAIANAVGCASAQHFTELFRAEVGVPPGTWRDAQKLTS